MNRVPPADPAEFADLHPSRRSLLRGGTLLGLAAAGAAYALSAGALASTGPAGARAAESAHARRLVFDYQPSQVTGWSPPYSPTLGGHTGSKGFTWQGRSYRVSLLPFGQRGGAPNPVYEDDPADTTVKFQHTLAQKWDRYYTFRYLGGLPAGAWFTVESYGAFQGLPPNPHRQSGTLVGTDLYAVYHPGHDRTGPAVNSDLQFIQVVYYQVGAGTGDHMVDTDRANPFYGEGGGLTSIRGNQSVSFSDFGREGFGGKTLPRILFVAETFLAQDTRTKDAAGKDVVRIFGGLKWGWQLQSAS